MPAVSPLRQYDAVAAFLALYCLLLVADVSHLGYAEPLFVLLAVGGGFSFAAWLLTRAMEPEVSTVVRPRAEAILLLAWLVVIAAFLGWGIPLLRSLGRNPLSGNGWVLLGKLVVFVAGPLALWRWRFGTAPSRLLGLPVSLRGQWRAVLGMGLLLAGFQLVFGRASQELADLAPSVTEVVLATVLGLVWLIVEVGLVEEFFFRAMLQERLTAWLGSAPRAIVATAALFGLTHVPGLYLRPETTGEAVSGHTLGAAIGYGLLLTSVTGFFLGVLWQRTRNLAALALVHAVNDLVPGLADVIRLMRHA